MTISQSLWFQYFAFCTSPSIEIHSENVLFTMSTLGWLRRLILKDIYSRIYF